MNRYWRQMFLQFLIISVLFEIGYCYGESGHHYDHYDQPYHQFGTFDSGNSGIRNNGNCPLSRPFPPNAGKVTDNTPYECLPSYLRNPNAVIDDDDGTTEWLGGQKPDYSIVNEMFDRERSIVHPSGSMEDRMTNLMKNWDKELHYKPNPSQWVTLVPDNFYMINNGGPRMALPELLQLGSYNAFLGRSEFYSKDYINSSTADQVFQTALKSGFALEVLEVFSPPPRVAFRFRHWGHMTGPLRCPMRNGAWLDVPPHGGKVEFFGNVVLHLNEKWQVLDIENTFRGDTLMEQMVLGTGTGTRANTANVGSQSWN